MNVLSTVFEIIENILLVTEARRLLCIWIILYHIYTEIFNCAGTFFSYSGDEKKCHFFASESLLNEGLTF